MKKVTAPAGPMVHGPENPLLGERSEWWVNGVIYTSNPEAVARFTELGYPMEDVADAPDDYLTGVEWMREKADRDGYASAVPTQDALDPNRRNY
ncbi:hypothetical protein [Streptomyces cinereoruber]|uniref:hypothetical protein n=1 Tax=Streptomyces cinereoruber TaxID=67260 RepID=UPI00364CD5D9